MNLWEQDVVFSTREFAAANECDLATASRKLSRAAHDGQLTRITRGVWANTAHPHFHPLACVSFILGPEQGHVSFLTALHLHGALSQIPRAYQIATTGRGRVLDSPVGRFELFQLAPAMMMQGVVWSDTQLPYRIATVERALLDTLYLSTRRGRRFRSLPELDLDAAGFRPATFKGLVDQMRNPRLAAAVRSRAADLQADPSA